MLVKGQALVISGTGSAPKALSIATDFGGRVERLTYDSLCSSNFALSKLLSANPSVVIVDDTPWPDASYVREFIKHLVASPTLTCDLPGKYPSVKATPQFIFLVNSKKRLTIDNEWRRLKVINL